MYDLIIRNGNVVDGTGNPSTNLDIGISKGKISTMGNLKNKCAQEEIDATKLIVSPGFIDTHTHSDLMCIDSEEHKKRVSQGITTELLGQDGLSVAPVSENTKPQWQRQLKGLDGDIGDWPWNSISEYLNFLEISSIYSNLLYLVPHGAIRSLIMGFANKAATKKDLEQMKNLVEKGMEQGAVGFSTGLIYPPNLYSNKKELIEICKSVAKYDGCFVVHIRNESNYALEAFDEVIDVARVSNVRLHISHFKIIGIGNRYKFKKALEKMEQAKEEGIEITFDQYPYSRGSSVLHSLLPPWAHDGGTEEMIKKINNNKFREKIKYEMENDDSYDNSVINCGWDGIFITSVGSDKNKDLEGLNINEISRYRQKKEAECVLDLLVEEKGEVTMVNQWGKEEDIMYGMKHPLQMVGSDGIFGGKPHPRLYGSYSRILGEYVRERKELTLTEAIRKMTSAPAQLLRLKDRGLIQENYWADICIFDPQTIKDNATYQNPHRDSEGIYYVIVNGVNIKKPNESASGMVVKRNLTRLDS